MKNWGDPIDFLIAHNSLLADLEVNGYEVIIIVWNLLLVLVPIFLYFLLFRLWRESGFVSRSAKFWGVVLGFLWLLFLPNAAYLVTEIRHLLGFCPIDSEFDICPKNAWMIAFFFFYAMVGWPIFVYLVKRMTNIVLEAWGGLAALLFQALIPPVCALGVLLGLVSRWNSWEIFMYPAQIFDSVATIATNDKALLNWAAFTALYYLLYVIGLRLFAFARD